MQYGLRNNDDNQPLSDNIKIFLHNKGEFHTTLDFTVYPNKK